MCGICGFVPRDPEQPVDHDMLSRMAAILRHRGPDSEGFYVAKGVGLGVRRLSIIDVEGGDQPLANEDGTIVVMCNGEIYNYVELRRKLLAAGHRFRTASDAEVIVHLYEDYDTEFLHHLRGMFGLALWDGKRRRLILARDRLGIKPLHYAQVADGLFFGSEIKAILASGRITPRLEAEALRDVFDFGFVVTPRTSLAGITRLPAGHYLTYQQGRLSIRQYWEIDFPPRGEYNLHRTGDEWAEALRGKLTEAVGLHLQSDVPVGAWLSGGIDSSAVASLMHQITRETVQTFSLKFENLDFDEFHSQKTLDAYPNYGVFNQRTICRNSDLQLLPQTVWHCEDPFSSGVEIPRIILSRLASQSVKVVLAGEGSDEILGGYSYYLADKLSRPFCQLPLSLRRLLVRLPVLRWTWPGENHVLLAPREMNLARFKYFIGLSQGTGLQEKLFSNDFQQRLKQGDNPEVYPALPEHFSKWHPFVQLQFFDLKLRLQDYMVSRLDRVAMAHSLEVRVPFLDHEVVELCARIPPALKMRKFREKHILRRSMTGLLPEEIRNRKKRGLTAPYQQWFREELPEFAWEMLSTKRLRENGYFNPAVVSSLLSQHRSGKGDYGRVLMGVLCTQIWHDFFLRNWQPNGMGEIRQAPEMA